MIPKTRLEELKDKLIRVYIKGLNEPHCIQTGRIKTIGEHVLILEDETHKQEIYVPLDNIAMIKTT